MPDALTIQHKTKSFSDVIIRCLHRGGFWPQNFQVNIVFGAFFGGQKGKDKKQAVD
jgi:hypothetical protein